MVEFFDREIDDIGNTRDLDLIRIARHIAQKQTEPQFYSFEEREKYDLDGIARKRLRNNSLENDEFLRQDFGRAGNLWKIFYKSYERFATAFDGAMRRVLHKQHHGSELPVAPPSKPRRKRDYPSLKRPRSRIVTTTIVYAAEQKGRVFGCRSTTLLHTIWAVKPASKTLRPYAVCAIEIRS